MIRSPWPLPAVPCASRDREATPMCPGLARLIDVMPPTGNIPVFKAINKASRAIRTSGNASSAEVPPEKSRSAQRLFHPAARTPSGTAISHEISNAGMLSSRVLRARGTAVWKRACCRRKNIRSRPAQKISTTANNAPAAAGPDHIEHAAGRSSLRRYLRVHPDLTQEISGRSLEQKKHQNGNAKQHQQTVSGAARKIADHTVHTAASTPGACSRSPASTNSRVAGCTLWPSFSGVVRSTIRPASITTTSCANSDMKLRSCEM